MAKKAKQNKQSSIYVVFGSDSYLVASAYEKLMNSLLPIEDRAGSVYEPQLDRTEISDVLDELNTVSMFSEKRIVVLKNAESFISEYRASIEKYFDSPSPSSILVIVTSTWQKTTKLAKKLSSVGELIEVKELKSSQLPAYVSAYTKQKHQMTIDRQAAELLVSLAGDEPGRLCTEADKLAVYADGNKKITVSEVRTLVGNNRIFNAFAVLDAIANSNLPAALEKLRIMFAGDADSRFTVIGAFAYQLRRMFQAKAMLNKGLSRRQVEVNARVWYNKEAFFRQLQKFTLEEIGSALRTLARADRDIKTGGTSPETVIEGLVVKLCKA